MSNPMNIQGSIDDLIAYPVVVTEEMTAGGSSSSTSATTRSGGELGSTIGNALRDILGWRPNANDPKGFQAALKQAFDLKPVEGHVEWSWKQRSYAVQADLGAVTGAQASIYTRAKVALDQSLPLLEGLYPLNVSADPQDMAAIRSIITAELKQLVAELGVEGGPRVQRVEEFFKLLLGSGIATGNSNVVGGQLKKLGERFGFDPSQVNTIEEEQNFTNYQILVDYVKGLNDSWRSSRSYFDNTGNDVFLGTQLVQLSRYLAVIGESVDEVAYAMDTVFLRAAERQVTKLTYHGRKMKVNQIPVAGAGPTKDEVFSTKMPDLYIAELLDWVKRVCNEEGTSLINDAGKDGVGALLSSLQTLRRAVQGALLDTDGGVQRAAEMPQAYRMVRVQRALRDLATQLDDATRIASPVKRSAGVKVTAVSLMPIGGGRATGLTPMVLMTIGEGFQQGADIKIYTSNVSIKADQVSVISSGQLFALFGSGDVQQMQQQPVGTQWTVQAHNPDGTEGEMVDAFAFPV